MPIALAIFAVIIVVASAIAIVFPSELLNYVREVLAGPGIWWVRLPSILGVAFGLFLLWSISSKRADA